MNKHAKMNDEHNNHAQKQKPNLASGKNPMLLEQSQ